MAISRESPARVPDLLARHASLLMCPACGGTLELADDRRAITCAACTRSFACQDGIPLLFWPTGGSTKRDVTDVVRAFYEETPFPDYEDVDCSETLKAKAEQGVFARLLNEQIPHGWKVLECGCGTGQLSNYLGLTWGRTVFAGDLCLNSLRLGKEFQERNDVPGVCFLQMNLFRPPFRPGSVDVVISNGVLHHTGDPLLAFRTILHCVRPGGLIVIGLYNAYARVFTDLRRAVFRLAGSRLGFLDPRLRAGRIGARRRQAWFRDQYQHPHESKHTIDEVLDWFDRSGVEFVGGIPKTTAHASFSAHENLLEPGPRGSRLDHLVVQLRMVLEGGREGGFFIMIGRKVA